MRPVGWIAILLLAAAVIVLIGAEWPRLSQRMGGEAWAGRKRRRRRQHLRVIQGEENDDFAQSVQRDLENLPVIEERDDRQRR